MTKALGLDDGFETDGEFEEIDFPMVDDVEDKFEDERDYVDRCFQSFSPDAGVVSKPIRKIKCLDNQEPKINPGEMVVLLDYKSKQAKGRKNPLANYDVLHIGLPTGPLRVPLYEAEQFGRYLISVARSAIKKIDSDNVNDNVEVK